MATTLDIVIAIALGALLLLTIINSGYVIGEASQSVNDQVAVQQMLISNAQLVEGEFRNMGMGVHEDSATVLAAVDTAISFLTDLNRDGIPERIDYWAGPTSELAGTQNTQDRLLHRRVNNGTRASVGTVTRFSLKYFSQGMVDTLVPPIPSIDLDMIRVVEITMEVQNPFAQYRDPRDVHSGQREANYASSLWRQTRLASQNLKR